MRGRTVVVATPPNPKSTPINSIVSSAPKQDHRGSRNAMDIDKKKITSHDANSHHAEAHPFFCMEKQASRRLWTAFKL